MDEINNHQVDADYNEYIDGWELTSEKCIQQDCGGHYMTAFFANGPDDYTQKWKCDVCGDLIEE